MLNETGAYGGKCDGCGAEGVPIMKLSLGRDFFGLIYDRLTPSADVSPKWYCDACSVGKNLQRDFRDIRQEFSRLHKGDASVLSQPDELQRAKLRLKEIVALIAGAHATQGFLKSDDVSGLLDSLNTYQAAATR